MFSTFWQEELRYVIGSPTALVANILAAASTSA
jgi:hypothetical protein